MLNLHFYRFLLIFFCFITLSSCKKEGCTDSLAINFDNKAKNNDGSCEFLTDKFAGDFVGNEECNDNSNGTLKLVISRLTSTNDKVVLNNFTRYAIAPVAIVNGNEFTIENQNHQSGFLNVNITGSGIIANNTLTINYIATEGTDAIECSFIGNK